MLKWLLILVAIVTICLVAFCLAKWRRRRQTPNTTALPAPTGQDLVEPYSTVQVESPILSHSFQKAISSTDFIAELQRSSLNNLNKGLQLAGGEGTNIALQSLRLAESDKELVFTYSPEGAEMVRQGKASLAVHRASGRNLPFLKSTESGQTIEMLKGIPGNTAKLAAVSALVVSTAHIVSGADLAKKLESVSQGVEFLEEARRIDQVAELEAIYNHARVWLAPPLNDASIAALRGECRALTKLRSQWTRELQYRLKQIKDPKARSYLRRKLTRQRAQDRKVVQQIVPLEHKVALVEFSILLQLAISDAIGESQRRRPLDHEPVATG